MFELAETRKHILNHFGRHNVEMRLPVDMKLKCPEASSSPQTPWGHKLTQLKRWTFNTHKMHKCGEKCNQKSKYKKKEPHEKSLHRSEAFIENPSSIAFESHDANELQQVCRIRQASQWHPSTKSQKGIQTRQMASTASKDEPTTSNSEKTLGEQDQELIQMRIPTRHPSFFVHTIARYYDS